MAIIKYEIQGRIIDMSPVVESIDNGNLLGTMAALQSVLADITTDDNVIVSLARRIMHTGCLPTEKEIKEAINGNAKSGADNISEKFPVTNHNIPKCPACGSTKLQKLGIGTRAIDGFFFGRMSPEARAQFWCRNCDYRF